MATRSTQSDMTCRQVDEMESRASMDMEAKNSRIDNLQCVSVLKLFDVEPFLFYSSKSYTSKGEM